jgi:serine/threonine protein kinase
LSRRIGPYELVRPLGSGGFASTYEARHRVLGTRACLKIGADRALLLSEARLLWDLHHPSLPTLRDVYCLPDGRVALAMRFVEGQPLDQAAPIDVPTAVQVLGRLLRALRVLHHRGIVHNDIKPANIILEPDRHGVVLVDFGVSSVRPRSSSAASGYTPGFAAPEIEAGSPPLPESDLYSLGLSVMWALGGDPFGRVLPPGVPEPLLELLVALTRREASRRPRWDTRDPIRWLDRLLPHL